VLAADGLLLVGEVEAAVQSLEIAVSVALGVGNADTLVFAEATLAHLDMDGDRWVRAADRVHVALKAVDAHRMDDYPPSVLAFSAAARLAHHDRDDADAQRMLTRGLRALSASTYAFPSLAVRARLHLAQTYGAMGQVGTVRGFLREIDDVLQHRPALGVLLGEVDDLRTVVGAAGHHRRTRGSTPPLTPAELRVLPYLQTYLTIKEVAARLSISRNTASTQIGSIYRKLGVSSRSEAVSEAVAIGLLGE